MKRFNSASWVAYTMVVWLVSCSLSGCGGKIPEYLAVAQLPDHVAGASDEARLNVEKRLVSDGVRIVLQGEHYCLSIPVTRVFYEQSPRIKWGSYPLLNAVVAYLQQYRKVSVQVSVFSDSERAQAAALTRARARAVANYLWSQRIETRFVYAYGHAGDAAFANNTPEVDRSFNARIEITFKRVVA